jgi:hypothetical protein
VTDHVFSIRARRRDNLVVTCSCGRFHGETDEITLDSLAAAVDEHIVAAERDETPRYGVSGYSQLRCQSTP